MTPVDRALSILVTANHVLDHFKIIDGFGHVSVRDPSNAGQFYMTGSTPPAFVQSEKDLALYKVEDGSPVSPGSGGTSPWSERFTHSEVYKRYPEVQSVIHSHSQAVIAQGVSGVPLRPVFHMAAFLGDHVPVFDIGDVYTDGDARNMLVNSTRLGAALASTLSEEDNSAPSPLPAYTVSLQRGHGFTTWGTSLPEAVYRAVYTQQNAEIQNAAHLAQLASGCGNATVRYLSPQEWKDTAVMNHAAVMKAWAYFSRIAETLPIYHNALVRDTSDEKVWDQSIKR